MKPDSLANRSICSKGTSSEETVRCRWRFFLVTLTTLISAQTGELAFAAPVVLRPQEPRNAVAIMMARAAGIRAARVRTLNLSVGDDGRLALRFGGASMVSSLIV